MNNSRRGTRFHSKQRRFTAPTRIQLIKNRRTATWRVIASVYARVERKTTKESRTLTVKHRGWSCDNDDADGDVRGASRKDACECQSRGLYAVRQRRRKPVSDLKATTWASSERGQRRPREQQRTRMLPAMLSDAPPSTFGVPRDPENARLMRKA